MNRELFPNGFEETQLEEGITQYDGIVGVSRQKRALVTEGKLTFVGFKYRYEDEFTEADASVYQEKKGKR